MPTTANGVPYPTPDDLVRDGADDIRGVAEAVDSKLLAGIIVGADGRVYVGKPLDTALYRDAAGALRTPGQFRLGASYAVNLYEYSGYLKTDNSLFVGGLIVVGSGGILQDLSGVGIYVRGADRSYLSVGSGAGIPSEAGKYALVIQNSPANLGTLGPPSGGGMLFAVGGSLRWIGSSGTVTVIAPA